MFELWLNKAKEVGVVRDHISVIEPSGGIDSKKILFKNLNLEKMKKIQAIMKDLMNMDATDSESDYESDDDLENNEDIENCTNLTRHED